MSLQEENTVMSTEIESATEQGAGETAQCSQCGQSNVGTRKFCSGCGSQLREPCLRCGTLSFAGEKYCGDCGENLVESVERLIEQCKADLARVRQLGTECRYDEAVALLGPLREIEHPRLRRHVEEVNQLAKQLTAKRDEGITQAQATYREADALVADRDYEAALRLLNDIPPPLRIAETQRLLEEVRARLEEIASLDEELSTAIACERTLHLLPKVSRLLTLKPDHARATDLADRFRNRVGWAAEEKLAQHEYRGALEVLGQLPEGARSPELETLHQRLAELVWLSEDLRSAAVVDSTLVEVARRLGELAPDDQRVAKLAAEVRRRAKRADNDPSRAYPPWAAPPESTRLDNPIDWCTSFQRIGIKADLARPILEDHPGRLLAACGLALQGLQQAPMQLNLLPRENQTPLGRVTAILNSDSLAWAGRKRSVRTAWGLDLSASGLKAVKLAWEGKEEDVVIEDFDVVPHGKTITEALSDDETRMLVEETLGTFSSRRNVKADRICLGLPARTLLARRFTVPRVDPKRLEKVVAHEARCHIPIPLENVSWDYQVMESGDGERPPKRKQEVLLVAARRPQLVDRLATLRDAGVRVDVVQCDCLALYNFLAYEHFGGASHDGSASPNVQRSIALLDVGCDQTHLVVGSPDSVWFRSCGDGGEQFTHALVRELQVTAAQAEELKRRPARAESLCRMYNALEPGLEALTENARALLDAFTADNESQRIDRVLGCGGSFQLHGLLRFLRAGS